MGQPPTHKMKKFLFTLVSLFMLLGFTSCNQTVSDAGLVGKWQMQKIEAGGQVITNDHQVWYFEEDHSFYVSPNEDVTEKEYGGTWSLEGNILTTGFLPIPATVKTLNSQNLVLEAENQGQLAYRYTFKRL